MVLLRRMIGDALRARRQSQHRTLREVSTAANVSLGYLSEIERGQKEASSELLFSICDALGANLSEVLREVSDTMALAEQVGVHSSRSATPSQPPPRRRWSTARFRTPRCPWPCATTGRSRPRCGPPAPAASLRNATSSASDPLAGGPSEAESWLRAATLRVLFSLLRRRLSWCSTPRPGGATRCP